MVRRVAVFLAALFAAGLATVEPHASTSSADDQAVASASAVSVRASFMSELSCAVTTGSVIGSCPKALVWQTPPPPRPVIRLCFMTRYPPLFSALRREPAVCGSGFHPGTRVLIVIQGRYSSTVLRVFADATGAIHLPLPWAPCGLAPGKIAALDQHSWSNALPLRGRGCF